MFSFLNFRLFMCYDEVISVDSQKITINRKLLFNKKYHLRFWDTFNSKQTAMTALYTKILCSKRP